MTAEFRLSTEIYTLGAIQQGAQDFAHLCAVTVQPGNGDFRVGLTPKADRPYLAEEFLNYVLGFSAAEQLAS